MRREPSDVTESPTALYSHLHAIFPPCSFQGLSFGLWAFLLIGTAGTAQLSRFWVYPTDQTMPPHQHQVDGSAL